MSTGLVLAQATAGITDAGLVKAGAFLAGGLMLAGGAVGAAQGNGNIGGSVVEGITRQPAAAGRINSTAFIYVALVEAAYFINLAFMAFMIFTLAG